MNHHLHHFADLHLENMTRYSFPYWDGTEWKLQRRVFKRKTADETISANNTTLQDDNDLYFDALPLEGWRVSWHLSANLEPASDIKFSISIPSGAAGIFQVIAGQAGGSITIDSGSAIEVEGNNIGNAIPVLTATAGTNNVAVLITATVKMSTTPGDIKLQWAKNSAAAENTSVLLNSSMLAEQILD